MNRNLARNLQQEPRRPESKARRSLEISCIEASLRIAVDVEGIRARTAYSAWSVERTEMGWEDVDEAISICGWASLWVRVCLWYLDVLGRMRLFPRARRTFDGV